MNERKKRFGDRYDGYRVRSLSPMTYVVPFVMKTRNDASNLFSPLLKWGELKITYAKSAVMTVLPALVFFM